MIKYLSVATLIVAHCQRPSVPVRSTQPTTENPSNTVTVASTVDSGQANTPSTNPSSQPIATTPIRVPVRLSVAIPGVSAELVAPRNVIAFEPRFASPPSYPPSAERTGTPLPNPPEVKLMLRIQNSSSAPVYIRYPSDDSSLNLTVTGPNVTRVNEPGDFREIYFYGGWTTIAPNATYEIPVEYLRAGDRSRPVAYFPTTPGSYSVAVQLTAHFLTTAPSPNHERGSVIQFSTDPVTFEIR